MLPDFLNRGTHHGLRDTVKKSVTRPRRMAAPGGCAVIGAALGFASSFSGIGGGPFNPAVGTGAINVMRRRFSFRMNIPFFTVATAAPMDGFASSLAVLNITT